MCLGIPGRILSMETDGSGLAVGKVDFNGAMKSVCLAYVPEAKVGDFVVVHVGFAISRVDEAEAAKVFELLKSMGELGELQIPQPE